MSFGAVRGGGNLAKDTEFAVIILGVTLKLTFEPNGTPYCSRATIERYHTSCRRLTLEKFSK